MDEKRKKLIGMRVRECRNEIGLSQEGLAEKLGMKRTNVANYEGGRVVPPGNILLEMAEIFGVTTDYLLGISDDPDSSIPLDENLMQIQRAKRKLKSADKEKMDKMLENVKLSFLDAFNEDGEDEDDDDDL